MTGQIFRIDLPNVPRVQQQEGVFFGAFNIAAFRAMTSIDKIYFRHCEYSSTYLTDIGFPEEVLLPPLDLAPLGESGITQNQSCSELVEKVKRILSEWAIKSRTPLKWEDCYEWALPFGPRDYMNVKPDGCVTIIHNQWTNFQDQRLRAFCKWFCKLQNKDIPDDASSIRRVAWAAHEIANFPTFEHLQYGTEHKDVLQRVLRNNNFTSGQEIISLLRDALQSEGISWTDYMSYKYPSRSKLS